VLLIGGHGAGIMKVVTWWVWISFWACIAHATSEDKTIGKVVKLLQEMLEKSKQEADEDRVLFAKYKCYCDDNEHEKKKSIEDLTNNIEFLSTKIEELKGENGELSKDVAKLTADMNENEATRAGAESLREKSHEVFLSEESDMENAISGFSDAVKVLKELTGASLEQIAVKEFLPNRPESLVTKTVSSVESLQHAKDALRSIVAAVSPKLTISQKASVELFLQAPSASSVKQSGAIVKILKQMVETFEENLGNARDAEKAEQEAYEKYKEDKEEEYDAFKESREGKEGLLSSNDDELGTKKDQLEEAEQQKEDDEEFLEKLLANCKTKTREYEKRQMLRANENAAIGEAIAILNSDKAFATFAKTDATSTGSTGPSFLQVDAFDVRQRVEKVLASGAALSKSQRLQSVLGGLRGGNPFDRVIKEIEKMLSLIEEEGKEDKKQLDWCESERDALDDELTKRNDQIETLDSEITDLKTEIDDPETGLKKQIATTEEDLVENAETQKEETDARRKEHSAYMKNKANLNEAQSTIKRAIHVLKRYYDALERQTSELQLHDAPETFDNNEGQSGAGRDVLDMLEFILNESDKEEKEADDDEDDSKTTYDDTMQTLKDNQKDLQDQLAELKETIAEKKKSLFNKQTDLKDTKHAKEAIEKYLKEIKPGCDFITENYDDRKENRRIETEALEKADTLIKDTPAYKKFEEGK
jgi:DNA repair exonuclease SbcCD ATPase subunit